MSINLYGHQIHYFLSHLCCTNVINYKWFLGFFVHIGLCTSVVLQRIFTLYLKEGSGINA